MALQDRARFKQAWRRHRPPERTVPFELVVRTRSRWRKWALAGLGAAGAGAGLVLFCPCMTSSIGSFVFGVLEKLRLWAPELKELLRLTGAALLLLEEVTG